MHYAAANQATPNHAREFENKRLQNLFATGPKTELGKAKSSANSTKHGILASLPMMRGEMPENARNTFDALTAEFKPVGLAEEILVHKMTSHFLSFERASLFLVLEM